MKSSHNNRIFFTFLIFNVFALNIVSALEESEDLYEILGVKKTATQDEIKRAFRKKARLYHPDKSNAKNAEEMFKKIGNAYGILSNPKKRKEYDMHGSESSFGQYQPGGPFNHRNFNFDDIFSNFDDFEDDFHPHRRHSPFSADHFDMFEDFPSFFNDDDAGFGHGDSFFGSTFSNIRSSSQQKSHSGSRCTTVTQRVGNTVTTYTTCS